MIGNWLFVSSLGHSTFFEYERLLSSMYDYRFVNKRKARRLVALIAGVSSVVVATLSIVSFLGRFTGTFTVTLESSDVQLALSQESSFNTQTSFLRVDKIAKYGEFTYSDFDMYGDDMIDNETSDYLLGANYYRGTDDVESLSFFKYTFFVKNVGNVDAQYNISLNIVENKPSADGRTLDGTIRVMIYDNGQKDVYAKRSEIPHMSEQGAVDYSAPISVSEEEATAGNPFMGYAKMFKSSAVISTDEREPIDVGEVRRYTIVTWLEGARSSNQENAPQGASIKLGVEINAYEQQD